jgi:hypothetical protein
MRKLIVLFSVVALGLFVNTPIKAQIIEDVPTACKNWSNDIYRIVTAKGDFANTVSVKTLEGLTEKIVWTKNTLVIKKVTFYPASQTFKKSGKNYIPDDCYYDDLVGIWFAVNKLYQTDFCCPDIKK